jgi:hypothetical protein
MSILPPRMPGDSERMRWQDLPESGQAVTINQLRERFPEDDSKSCVDVVDTKENFKIIGRRFKKAQGIKVRIAYQCNACNGVFYGPPRIVDDNSIDDGIPLSGREGYDLYCHGCNSHLDSKTSRVS